MQCSICQQQSSGSYCSNCGQQLKKENTSVWSLGKDLIANMFSLDQSVFATVWKLIKDPKPIIDNYLKGYRGYYPSPVKMIVAGLILAALHLAYVHPSLLGISFISEEIQAQILFWILCLPLVSISAYLGSGEYRKGFTRHFISVSYLASTFFMVVLLINDLIILFFDDLFTSNVFLLFLSLIFFWNMRVFQPDAGFWRKLGFALLQLLVFALICLMLFGILYLLDPDSITATET